MSRFIDFLVGALVCHVTYLLYFDFVAQASEPKQTVTFYKSESECNKNTGIDCERKVFSIYVIKD